MKIQNKTEEKREKEKMVIGCMIEIYCSKNHTHKKTLCTECEEIKQYAYKRISCCPVMGEKTFCSNCKIHCYKPDMREKIKEIMRFSGPRMLFVHPLMALRHVFLTVKTKQKGAINVK